MACIAVFSYLLARYRVSGVLDWRHPWRFLMMTMVVALSLLGGFRTSLACCSILFIIQFILEGLHRTRCVAIFAIVPIIGATILVPFSDKMPLSVQRCLSFLPLKIDSSVRANAEHSTQWRLEMWSILWPEVDKYFWEGKGYTASATDYFLTGEAVRRGYATDHEMMILAGDYHNGALSIIIPFGIWGVIAFLWFLAAGTRVLHLNFRYGDPELKQWNIALYAGFLTKIIVFFFIYGAVHSDMVAMVGLVGLGVSLNGGVCRKPTAQERESERVSMVSQEPVAALPG